MRWDPTRTAKSPVRATAGSVTVSDEPPRAGRGAGPLLTAGAGISGQFFTVPVLT
jgi:hypothetical protein